MPHVRFHQALELSIDLSMPPQGYLSKQRSGLLPDEIDQWLPLLL